MLANLVTTYTRTLASSSCCCRNSLIHVRRVGFIGEGGILTLKQLNLGILRLGDASPPGPLQMYEFRLNLDVECRQCNLQAE
jgi:hypothetical protein